MNCKKPCMLFFDIDGTILPDYTGSIPEDTMESIAAAQENGHVAIINSGRTLCNMPKSVMQFPFDAYLMGCGTHLLYHGKTVWHVSFSKDTRNRIIDAIEKYNIQAWLEGADDIYIQSAPYREEYLNQTTEFYKSIGLCRGPFIEERGFDFDKMIIVLDHQSDGESFFREVGDAFDTIDRGRGMYELVNKGCSKATIMHRISSLLGMPLSESYAFGDSTNDLPMFQTAGHCIAMGKHAKELEPYSEMITDDADKGGIRNALLRLGLIGKS